MYIYNLVPYNVLSLLLKEILNYDLLLKKEKSMV